ncbi:hypothetical protein [Sedimenticola selenatireducens]|uniref:hypothetical protein n=1 Tax=Sedimenticola selenatireducens TaxID=191960 RepID=UPI002354F2D6|nr:hypothetical protein [Sedimenticola selenatireducens]
MGNAVGDGHFYSANRPEAWLVYPFESKITGSESNQVCRVDKPVGASTIAAVDALSLIHPTKVHYRIDVVLLRLGADYTHKTAGPEFP